MCAEVSNKCILESKVKRKMITEVKTEMTGTFYPVNILLRIKCPEQSIIGLTSRPYIVATERAALVLIRAPNKNDIVNVAD